MACNGLCGFCLGSFSFFHIDCQLALPSVQRVQPTLSTGRETSPITYLDYLRFREFGVQIGPECIVRQIRVPEHCIGITQSDFFALSESVGLQIVFQFV